MPGMEVDIAAPAHKADPYPFYARQRAEFSVHRVALPDGQSAWLVARYDDVAAALKDRRLVEDRANAQTPGRAARQPWGPPFFRPLTRNMLDLDEPDCTAIRSARLPAAATAVSQGRNGLLTSHRCTPAREAAALPARMDEIPGSAASA